MIVCLEACCVLWFMLVDGGGDSSVQKGHPHTKLPHGKNAVNFL